MKSATQEELNRKAAQLWLLVSSLNTVRFAIAEMEPQKMKGNMKMRYINLRNSVDNFLRLMQSNTPEDQKKYLAEMTFESVGTTAEALAMMLQVHPDQQEWFLDEVKKLTWQSVNRQALKQKQNENI